MKANKRPILIIGMVFLLTVMLTSIRGLAQEADGDIFLPAVFKPNGESAPTKTASPTSTATSTPTPTSSASATSTTTTDCALLGMADFEIRQYNRPTVRIINSSANPITITQFGLEWVSASFWAPVLGFDDLHVDWFKWEGDRFYQGDDYDEPTFVNAAITIAPGGQGEWEADFDWIGETDWAFIDEFGLAQENFGFFVVFDNGCALHRPEVVSLPPTPPPPTPTDTPTLADTPTITVEPTITSTPGPSVTPDCADFTLSDFEIGQYNRPAVQINNNSAQDAHVWSFNLTWQSAYDWAIGLGYSDIRVDWFAWNGYQFYGGDDFNTPTYAVGNEFLPAGGSGLWVADLDWSGETEWALIDEFGLTQENFGFWVGLDNGCVLERYETYLPPPYPTPLPIDSGGIKSASKGSP